VHQSSLYARSGEQVKGVAIIYQQASSVVSWLGEATDDNDMAVDLVRLFSSIARAYLHDKFPGCLTPSNERNYLLHKHSIQFDDFLEEC